MAKLIVGVNDLATVRPDLIKEWNYNRNIDIKPEDVTCGSGKKVWWICEQGHEWECTVNTKNKCPYCTNRKVLKGYNDLASASSYLVKEWNWLKNGGLNPEEVSKLSEKTVWWVCSQGHEWKATVNQRYRYGTNCPYCSNKKVKVGYNDLGTTNSELVDEWDYERNTDLSIKEVSGGSAKTVWWKCNMGHRWQAKIVERTKGKTGCPYCRGKLASEGFNDLATEYPDLVKDWLNSEGMKAMNKYNPMEFI